MKNIFKNKKVVVIGPSPELENLNKTDFFSTFDLIVNINGTYILDDKYGKRCDVLFNTTNESSIKKLIQNKECIINKKIKYLIGTHLCNKRQIQKKNWHEYCAIVKNINQNIICYDISDFSNDCEKFYNKYTGNKCQFHTGTFTLAFLLSCELKELYIDGITFYNDGKFGKVWNNKYQNRQLQGNTHKGTMQMEKDFINSLISKAPFKVNFDESYCPLKKNYKHPNK